MADHYQCEIQNIDVCLEELFGDVARECKEEMSRGIDKTMKDMVKLTKTTVEGYGAPRDGGKWEPRFHPHRPGGTFAKAITWKKKDYAMSHSAIWYVKSPEYRLTHLLEKGHELFVFGKPTGKRTKAHGFIKESRDQAEKVLIPNIMAEMEDSGR